MSLGIEGELKGQRSSKATFLTHPAEPIDMYLKYLSEGPQPIDELNNSRNLFDDSNRVDRIWFKRAMYYLKNLR